MSDGDDGFLSRWSRRKAALRDGRGIPEPESRPTPLAAPTVSEAVAAPVPETAPVDGAVAEAEAPDTRVASPPPDPPPSMDDVQALTPASDFSRFTRGDVDPAVRNAAMKKLFADPRFNVIDEMDIDIMDYGKLEPLPANLLRRMAQAHSLGLFRDEERDDPDPPPAVPDPTAPAMASETSPEAATGAAPATLPDTLPPADEDPDLRLQPDDAAGPAGDRPRAEDDAGRER